MGSGATPVQVAFNENDAKFCQLNKKEENLFWNLHESVQVLYIRIASMKNCRYFRRPKMEVLIILDVWLPISLVGSPLL